MPAWLTEIQRFLPQPSLTILLDMPPDASLKRKKADRDKFERDLPLLGRVRESYLRQAQQSDWIRLEGRARQGRRLRRRDHRRSFTTRAAVSARTSFTPLRFNTVAQASSVAPVVDTSSTRTTMRGSGIRDRGSGAKHECVLHIPMPFVFRQLDLRSCEHDALQQRDDRHAEMPREIVGLIESALILAARMQRHRHDDVGILQAIARRSSASARRAAARSIGAARTSARG